VDTNATRREVHMSKKVANITLHPVIKNKEDIIRHISEIFNNAVAQIDNLDIDVEVLTEPADASQDRTKDR
jgi:hypothetical protein